LYDISEKIRYELLGTNMLRGISKNLNENYKQKLTLKRKDQLKSKEDVNVVEAFELYMLKNFLNIKLNSISSEILSFWEKEFNSSIDKHIKFLHDNVENQEAYNSKFSKLLEEMGVFDSENENEKQDNQDKEQNNENNNQNQADSEQEKTEEQESQNGLDGDYDFDDYSMNEQLVDTDSEKQSSENIIQKMNIDSMNKNYNIFTSQFDEIAKAEKLETDEEITKLRNNLDQQLVYFPRSYN
jgi:Cobalamin biosynthesis protein CobT (nicotinate-mononucleotide:5, 6-dimethylbenzimidazole phosphoribosyltransferase)